ncbi:MAG: hypothetical protein L6R40_004316 [Gallowayella cf. fulva]|nr:MAG: hypothetical protein L6R40_004316 [Xanthomendoza cf. fulva]
MTLTGFGAHRDTLAMLDLRRVKTKCLENLPTEVFVRILRFLDIESYKSIRLTCRCWSAAATYARPLHLSPVYTLPAELVKHIYAYLPPLDMNVARHTCRKWMIASLDYRLLAQVLTRSGFWPAVEADAARNETLGHPIGGEWRLSKRLATECSLCSGWYDFTGSSKAESPLYLVLTPGPLPAKDMKERSSSCLKLMATIDFTGLVGTENTHHQERVPAPQFNMSICGRFLFVLNGSIINVYYIRDLASSGYRHDGQLEFLIAIACPSLVLAISMDTSKDRYSIAALLEDRKGVVIDISELSLIAKRSCNSSPYSEHDTHNVTEAWDLKASPTATPTTSQRPRLPLYTDVYHASPTASSPDFIQLSPVPIQFIPHTMYRNLCSKTCPPLTVAIAPHRRCVAFGSSAGIELHWQDVTTGQELSRWMGLIGPAEYINFLFPRKEDEKDLARSIRLTSSRSGPIHYHDPVSLNEAWDYEHCKFLHAVPLSDSRHLLYTDPNDGDLCLGTGLHYPFGKIRAAAD